MLKKKKLVKYVYKPNKSNIIKGVYKIIESIIKGSLKKEELKRHAIVMSLILILN